jgi:hypothetical protein
MLLEVATYIFKCNPLCCKHNISAQEIFLESKCSQNQVENNTKNDLNKRLFFGQSKFDLAQAIFCCIRNFLGNLDL